MAATDCHPLFAMTSEPIQTVEVDSARCCFHYFCLGECPEVFAVDPTTEQAVVRPDAAQWFASKAAEVRFAAVVCPVAAILINGQAPASVAAAGDGT